MRISNEAELRKLYGWPQGRAKSKTLKCLEQHSKNFIVHSPFFIMSTYDSNGRADASPRGGEAGFVKILDTTTLLVPDTKGNNRVDSLVNIVETGALGCIFFIPGLDETLRINGNAIVTIEPSLLDLFKHMQNKPKSCLKISIEEVFLHCAKAFMRSKLWGPENRIKRPGFPTMGAMLNDQIGKYEKIESQEEMVHRYKKDL